MISRAGHYEPIAREGFPFFVPLLFVSFVLWWVSYPWASLFFLVFGVAVAAFFRNPERTGPRGEDLVLSPADGRVMEIVEGVRSPNILDVPLKRMSIFMSVFNVHVNRSPVTGTVKKITYVPGRFLDAREAASSIENEHNSLVLEDGQRAIEVVQVAGKVARRIACWVGEGDPVGQGERFGLIRFGSRLDVYLPEGSSFVVPVGTRVRAGVTVIARKGAANTEPV